MSIFIGQAIAEFRKIGAAMEFTNTGMTVSAGRGFILSRTLEYADSIGSLVNKNDYEQTLRTFKAKLSK